MRDIEKTYNLRFRCCFLATSNDQRHLRVPVRKDSTALSMRGFPFVPMIEDITLRSIRISLHRTRPEPDDKYTPTSIAPQAIG